MTEIEGLMHYEVLYMYFYPVFAPMVGGILSSVTRILSKAKKLREVGCGGLLFCQTLNSSRWRIVFCLAVAMLGGPGLGFMMECLESRYYS